MQINLQKYANVIILFLTWTFHLKQQRKGEHLNDLRKSANENNDVYKAFVSLSVSVGVRLSVSQSLK